MAISDRKTIRVAVPPLMLEKSDIETKIFPSTYRAANPDRLQTKLKRKVSLH
jgi:hypothetical protein